MPKIKLKRTVYDSDYKAEIVARALRGAETINAIATSEGMSPSNITNWIKAARKAGGARAPAKKKLSRASSSGSDLQSLSRDLIGEDGGGRGHQKEAAQAPGG